MLEDSFEEDEIIIMVNDKGEEKEFAIIDAVRCGEGNYLLVADAKPKIQDEEDDEELDAVILKELQEEDEQLIYEIVEEDKEFERVIKLFQENEDFDIKL